MIYHIHVSYCHNTSVKHNLVCCLWYHIVHVCCIMLEDYLTRDRCAMIKISPCLKAVGDENGPNFQPFTDIGDVAI